MAVGMLAITGLCGKVWESLRERLIVGNASDSSVICFEPDVAAIEALLQGDAARRVAVIYAAPWDAFLESSDENIERSLRKWMEFHAGLLRLRQTFIDRLVFVNVGRLRDSRESLSDEFGELAFESDTTSSLSALAEDEVLSRLRSKVFEWMAPEVWDLYEVLESCAWLGNGQPEYRDGLEPPDSSSLGIVGEHWRLALSAPDLLSSRDAELELAAERIRVLTEQAKSAAEQLEQYRQQASLQQHRYQQVLMDLDQVRQELVAQAALHQQQLRETEAQVQELQATNREVEAERMSLSGKVAEQAERLEDSFQRETQLRGELERQLREADVLAHELEAAKASAAQQQSSFSEEIANLASRSLAREKKLEGESAILLDQLHQVQETLESEVGNGRRLAARLREAEASMTAQRTLAATLTTELDLNKVKATERIGQLEEALRAKEEASRTTEQELTEALATASKRGNALETRNREAEKRVAELSDQLKNRFPAEEAQKLKQALLQAQTETEMLRSTSEQEAAKHGQREKSLREALALAESRALDASRESSLLLDQLHTVQEELGVYFRRSRDATIALERSTRSFDRARRVVAQLVQKAAV
jgi:hypothetical protein